MASGAEELRVGDVLTKAKVKSRLRLTSEALMWACTTDKTKGGVARLDVLFGADLKNLKGKKAPEVNGRTWYPFFIRAMPYAKNSTTKRTVQSIEMWAESDTEAAQWVASIREAIALHTWYQDPTSPWQLSALVERQPVLVLINPVGGTKKGPVHYTHTIKPMLRSAGLNHEMRETEHAGHATEIGRSVEVGKYSAIVTVSGDGLLHELLQGFMDRPDWEEAVKIPVSIIPAGSGNGLMRSLLVEGQMAGTFNVIKGHVFPYDIMSVSNFSGKVICYSHLAVFWAILADADIESERYRWAGSVRFTIGAVVRLLNLRSYRGILRYLPAEDAPANDGSDQDLLAPAPVRSFDLTDPSACPSGWQTVDSEFVMFCAANVGWVSTDAQIAPYTALADGSVDIVYIEKGISKDKLIKLFLQLEDGGAMAKSPECVKYVKARAFSLIPKQDSGILDVDGEVIDYEPLTVEVHHGLARVIAPADILQRVPEESWEGSAKYQEALKRKR